MSRQNKLNYNRTLKLAAALGDWTKLTPQDTDIQDVNISPVQSVSFDSLPRHKMKDLHLQHYQFADQFVKMLSKDMDIKMELHTVHAQQISYQQFLKIQDSQVVQSRFIINKNCNINMIFDWKFAELIVHRLVGGKGEDVPEHDTFTGLERAALEVQMENTIPLLVESWGDIFKAKDIGLSFSIGQYQYDKKVALRQAYVVFSFDVLFADYKLYKMTMAYPSDILRNLISAQSAKEVPFSPKINLDLKTLKTTKIPILAHLGKTELTMSQIKALRPGSLVMLDSLLNKPLSVTIGNVAFWMQVGIKREQLALQLLEPNKSINTPFHFVLPVVKKDDEMTQKTPDSNSNIGDDMSESIQST